MRHRSRVPPQKHRSRERLRNMSGNGQLDSSDAHTPLRSRTPPAYVRTQSRPRRERHPGNQRSQYASKLAVLTNPGCTVKRTLGPPTGMSSASLAPLADTCSSSQAVGESKPIPLLLIARTPRPHSVINEPSRPCIPASPNQHLTKAAPRKLTFSLAVRVRSAISGAGLQASRSEL